MLGRAAELFMIANIVAVWGGYMARRFFKKRREQDHETTLEHIEAREREIEEIDRAMERMRLKK